MTIKPWACYICVLHVGLPTGPKTWHVHCTYIQTYIHTHTYIHTNYFWVAMWNYLPRAKALGNKGLVTQKWVQNLFFSSSVVVQYTHIIFTPSICLQVFPVTFYRHVSLNWYSACTYLCTTFNGRRKEIIFTLHPNMPLSSGVFPLIGNLQHTATETFYFPFRCCKCPSNTWRINISTSSSINQINYFRLPMRSYLKIQKLTKISKSLAYRFSNLV